MDVSAIVQMIQDAGMGYALVGLTVYLVLVTIFILKTLRDMR